MTAERWEKELLLLRRKYASVDHGGNMDWVLFKEFSLPSCWHLRQIDVLVIIPPGYPTAPPDNFYVRGGLHLAGGGSVSNYSEGQQTVLGSGWGQFSFHVHDWSPAPIPEDGDNLLTFMLGVERRLQEGA